MSWSVSLIGKPQNVASALDAHSTKLRGQCKLEFDAALPNLKGLVLENFVGADKSNYCEPVVILEASGSGCGIGGEQVHRSCIVSLKTNYCTLV